MNDPGYTDYRDGRLQPPEEEDRDCCGSCSYFRDVTYKQTASGATYCVGACVREVFEAITFAALDRADVETVCPEDGPCKDYREER